MRITNSVYYTIRGEFAILGSLLHPRSHQPLAHSIPRPQQMRHESEATLEVNRIGAHTDFCSITLLVQDEVGGLEVESPTRPGVFMVRVLLGANSSIYLTRKLRIARHTSQRRASRERRGLPCYVYVSLASNPVIIELEPLRPRAGSNDLIRSTMHRVRAPPSCSSENGIIPDRYSIVYVSDPFLRHRWRTLTVLCDGIVLRDGGSTPSSRASSSQSRSLSLPLGLRQDGRLHSRDVLGAEPQEV
jgi:hypothetical protein